LETKSSPSSNGKPSKPDLLIDDSDRYSRLRLIGWWDQEKIAAAKILVVGAGALGNEVLKNLALLGLGNIHLLDFDEVKDHNLTRSVLFRAHHEGQSKAQVAAEMASELNPDCKITAQHGDVLTDIGLGLVRDCDLVICCVDNREARLWIQEINGVAKVFMPPGGSCYECAMTENDYRLISLRYSCPLLKQEDIQQGKVPTAPTIASIVGGLQVQEALKLIHELPAAQGTALVFNGAANKFYQTRFPRREDCLSHETYDNIIELELGADATAERLFKTLAESSAAESAQNKSEFRLLLDRDFLTEMECRSCGSKKEIFQPLCKVGASQGLCTQCREPLNPQTTCEVAAGTSLANRKLSELGVPSYDIVKVAAGDRVYFVLLAADAPHNSSIKT